MDPRPPRWGGGVRGSPGVLPDPVAILDRDGTICYIDPAGVRLLDRPAGELTGRSIWGATLARCVAGDGTEVR